MRRVYLLQILGIGAALLLWLSQCNAPTSRAALHSVQVLRVQPLGEQTQVTVLIVSDAPLAVSTVATSQLRVFPATDSSGVRRTTITATLDKCDGRISISDGPDRWDWRPYCQYLPTIGANP